MPRVPWSDVLKIQPRPHLVVVALPEVEQLGPDLKHAQATLTRWLGQRMPGAVCLGSSIVRTISHPEVHFAFADEADASRFADELGAGMVDRYPGWASQRAGDLTVRKLGEMGALAPPRAIARNRGERDRNVR
jgi:hypothetical protein